eukprot:CAMPEP_0180655008 /NCGR_PEP_ID=MMETSP1037_2-20121125/55036_1 /TAXON_ID=632150 /ORGANISM="Azadinium spinosum, Strain 3D9" /LENGTH=36 /DNA_ID= /DNA_START= /DNA_END= /DNA_ORIENTATION=
MHDLDFDRLEHDREVPVLMRKQLKLITQWRPGLVRG